MINKENYEAYLLDMIEGRLTGALEKELLRFLDENPDLPAEPGIRDIVLPCEAIEFPEREDIKKGGMGNAVTPGNYGQFCIARMENDLSAGGRIKLEAFLEENPEFARDAMIYDHLVLKPDHSVVFQGKRSLKKRKPVIKLPVLHRGLLIATGIAASLAILVSLFAPVSWFDGNPGPAAGNGRDISTARQLGERAINSPAENNTVESIAAQQPIAGDIPAVIPPVAIPLPEPGIRYDAAIEDHAEIAVTRSESISRIEPLTAGPYVTSIRTETYEPVILAAGYRVPVREERVNSREGMLGGLINVLTADREPGQFSLAAIASAGLRGINSFASSAVRLEKEYDEEGNLVSFAFASPAVEFRRTSYLRESR